MLPALVNITLTYAYIHIYCFHLYYYNDLSYYMHMCYIHNNGGAFWWAICRILICHTSATSSYFFYTLYIMAYVYAYICLFTITTTYKILLLTKTDVQCLSMNMLDTTTLVHICDGVSNCLYCLFLSMPFMLLTLCTLLTIVTVPFLPLLG